MTDAVSPVVAAGGPSGAAGFAVGAAGALFGGGLRGGDEVGLHEGLEGWHPFIRGGEVAGEVGFEAAGRRWSVGEGC